MIAAMEPPECPVCLQPYDPLVAIPRVLVCGHSACEACLGRLPVQFPGTVRCPACTQLAPMPRPSALPKNIELLRLVETLAPGCRKERRVPADPPVPAPIGFVHRRWDSEFYNSWKDDVIPSDAVVLAGGDEQADWCRLRFGNLDASKYLSCSFRSDQKVSLLLIANLSHEESEFVPSYTVRVMEALYCMKSRDRDDLRYIIRAASNQRNLCKLFGLWLDLGNGLLFLVSERYEGDISDSMAKLRFVDESSVPIFAMAGLDICESIISLHYECLMSGLFTPSCFRFNEYGHFLADMNEILVAGRRVWTKVMGQSSAVSELVEAQAFVGPELQTLLWQKCISEESDRIGKYESDIWSLACLFCRILLGNEFDKKFLEPLFSCLQSKTEENNEFFVESYNVWIDQCKAAVGSLLAKEFGKVLLLLCQCLDWDPTQRPQMIDLWKCFRGCLVEPHADVILSCNLPVPGKVFGCLTFGSLCSSSERNKRIGSLDVYKPDNAALEDLDGSPMLVDGDVAHGLLKGQFKSLTMQGHMDCITGLAVGGGFLFSSSFDKKVQMWSLQDFSLVKSFRGHEHRVTAVVVVDADHPLCISGDSGCMIFVWELDNHHGSDPLRKWNEHNEWRYSGVHSLAVAGTEFLYSGSGDKSIKAWSLKDYTLAATMVGHKSVVSSLAVSGGILYSGSWDGTIRLWWLNDHSPLSVLGEDTTGSTSSVLSLSVDSLMLAASHENGCIKVWKNEKLVHSAQTQTSAIFSVAVAGKLLFTGGWNGNIDVQEVEESDNEVHTKPVGSISCPAVVTALLYWQGKLIVGFVDKVIKVYFYDSRSEI